MTTARQFLANKSNSGQSTGPKTLAGKERSSANARRHGVSSPFDSKAPAVIAFARTLFPELAFEFGLTGPDARQAAALRFAAAEMRIERIRVRQSENDLRIHRVVMSRKVADTAKSRGLEAVFDKIGLTDHPDPKVVSAVLGKLKITGDLTLLDPLTQGLREKKLLARYRKEAEAERRSALDALSKSAEVSTLSGEGLVNIAVQEKGKSTGKA